VRRGYADEPTATADPMEQISEENAIPRIQKAFRAVLNIDVENPDQDVIDSGMLDSLGLIELLVEVEREFGVQLDLEELDIDDFRTPRRIAGVVSSASEA
jgi:methoxymalonate biosynthesis acyl carrier protein